MAEDTDHMNIFLAELKEEDVCTTMYAAQYSNREQTKVSPATPSPVYCFKVLNSSKLDKEVFYHKLNHLDYPFG